jgi:NAD(P)H-hydrate repair Nnr-like enzyme with NAD(P)H-hydrate epimerase domain
MTNTAPLPRIDARDTRTIAERTPQIPATVWVVLVGESYEVKVHTLVGTGGWASDAREAAARELDAEPWEITVVAVQGGHR